MTCTQVREPTSWARESEKTDFRTAYLTLYHDIPYKKKVYVNPEFCSD